MAVKKRLLLIDDDDDLREELAEQFALYDEFETAGAATATAGIELAKASPFDLILLDVDLPDMLGTEAWWAQRASGFPGELQGSCCKRDVEGTSSVSKDC